MRELGLYLPGLEEVAGCCEKDGTFRLQKMREISLQTEKILPSKE
jgi:hypothetical protein